MGKSWFRGDPLTTDNRQPTTDWHWLFPALWLCLVSCAGRPGTERGAANLDGRFWESVEQADVIYVGETHDDSADHQRELDLVRGLLKRKIKFAIGWEMFDTSQQPAMDAWDSHAISLTRMLAETDFQKHWGIYSPAYEQILRMAGKAGVPNLALNAPPELPHKVARGESLTAKERAMIPIGFTATEAGYRNFVAMMGGHPGMSEEELRHFFAAQNIWDQTMASRILEFKVRNPKTLLVVLTGRGHVSGGFGIPFYVRQKATLKQSFGHAVEIVQPAPCAFSDHSAGLLPLFFRVRVICFFERSPEQVVNAQFFGHVLPTVL
jgi:uncharacterized iron-regulated protein